MREAAGDNQRLVDYILGNLRETDEARLEAEYLTDSRLQEQLLFIEDELVDAYVQGHLSTDDRARLEARFLASPRGRRKLELANSLVRVAIERQSREKERPRLEQTAAALPKPASARAFPIRRMLTAAAALLLVLALSWSFRQRLLHRSEQTQSAGQGTERRLPAKAGDQESQAAASVTVSILLKPASRNLDRVERANISPGVQEVNIQLDVGTALHNSYRVVLVNARDQVKWTGSGFKPQPIHSIKVINLNLPTSLLERGEYTLLLSPNENGARVIAEYVFFVEKP